VRPIGSAQQTFIDGASLIVSGQLQLKRLKELEQENQHMQPAVYYLTLEKLIVSAVARQNF